MKKNSKNNNFLNDVREDLSPKMYDEVLKLVNGGREDLANEIAKIDYLLEYTSKCIKVKDFAEARMSIESVKARIQKIKDAGFKIEYIEYLYEGIKKKVK
ncbi:hypothetical protein [uncultured Clostridium sp.]|uniref:hypothetical protein n=1 Tax=uncultured Clostridium sp. TaxID=59620 RepID=UPI002609F3C3|nr:hypothetical protein [uncultured Clostridium sp.]